MYFVTDKNFKIFFSRYKFSRKGLKEPDLYQYYLFNIFNNF